MHRILIYPANSSRCQVKQWFSGASSKYVATSTSSVSFWGVETLVRLMGLVQICTIRAIRDAQLAGRPNDSGVFHGSCSATTLLYCFRRAHLSSAFSHIELNCMHRCTRLCARNGAVEQAQKTLMMLARKTRRLCHRYCQIADAGERAVARRSADTVLVSTPKDPEICCWEQHPRGRSRANTITDI